MRKVDPGLLVDSNWIFRADSQRRVRAPGILDNDFGEWAEPVEASRQIVRFVFYKNANGDGYR